MARLLLLTFLVATAGPGVALAGVLTSLHIKPRPGQDTTLVLTVKGLSSFHDFALGNPPRAVLDLPRVRERVARLPQGAGAIRDIRMARHRNGMLRVVADLRAGARLVGVSRHGDTIRMTLAGGRRAPAKAAPRRSARGGDAVAYQAGKKSAPVVVALDPGHGGKDPGTHGPHGLKEKTVTLAIARRVYRKLAATPGVEPIMTRDRDVYVSLPKRVAIAQRHHADLFVSMHENSFPKQRSVKGGTCYILSRHGASSAEARQVAALENKADPVEDGVHFSQRSKTLNTVLTQLFQSEAIGAAHRLADDIIYHLGNFEPLYHRTPPRANFAVLRDPMIPSVLCETAFLSNSKQAQELHTARFRSEIANAIYRGIMQYLHNNPPMQALPAHGNTYIVKRGDTLSGIARAHGVPRQRLMAINDLRSAAIDPGQRLIVPRQAGG